VGQCRSLAMVKPQGIYHLSYLYEAVTGLNGATRRITLSMDFREEVATWYRWVAEKNPRPVSLHSIANRTPTLLGFSDAAGKLDGGMGGFWHLPEGGVVWWREIFPPSITSRLTRRSAGGKKMGDITINDLELAGIIANFVVIRQTLGDAAMKYAVLLSRADNVSAVSWIRRCSNKGKRVRQLLKILEELLDETECNILSTFIAGKDNLADLPSRSFTAEFLGFASAEETTGDDA
jgi:hypothetical protein